MNTNIIILLLILIPILYYKTNTNIIILLLILTPILYIIFISYHTKKSTTNKNDDTNIKTIPCGVLSSLTIKKCDENSDICKSCQCSSNPSIIENCMTCTTVNEQNKYVNLLSIEDCKDPFEWNNTIKKCQLKDGKYCLPVEMNDITCNPYTSDKVLTLKNNVYQWTCLCKNPFKFDGDTCSNIKICGLGDGTSNPRNNRALIKKGTESNPDYWNKTSEWDPLTDSKCLCAKDEFYEEKSQSCLPSTCGFGVSQDKNHCKDCPKGYISCDQINIDSLTQQEKGICVMPSCVSDPCGKNGYLSNTGVCVCNDGYFDLPDPGSVIGHSCQNPCSPENNPCGQGNEKRGECYVWTKDNDNIVWTIECFDSSIPCTTYSFRNKENYLASNFTLKGVGDSTTTFSIEGTLGKNKQGYVKTKTDSQYLDFRNKTIKQSSDKTLLITFLQDSDCDPTKNEFKLQNPDESYISGNLVNGTINTNSQSWKGTARCNPCISGNAQDSQGLCNQTDPGDCGCGYKFLDGCQVYDGGNNCKNGYQPICNLNLLKARCDCNCIRGL
jgi:hypothetical protein